MIIYLDQWSSTFFYKIASFNKCGCEALFFHKKMITFACKFLSRNICRQLLKKKYDTHNEKQRQFLEIQQYDETNVTLAADVALQHWQKPGSS